MLTGTGVIATGVAYLNYRNAKSDYEALLEKRDGLLAAVKQFNLSKDEDYIEALEREYQLYYEVLYPKDVKCTAILRTSYLVGKAFRCIASVVLTNFSDKTYQIGYVGATCFLQDLPIKIVDLKGSLNTFGTAPAKEVPQSTTKAFELQPGETREIVFTGGVSSVMDMNALRAMVCSACGKKLITSCPKVSIENGIRANIVYRWREAGEEEYHRAEYRQIKGVFRYCMEAPLYANS